MIDELRGLAIFAETAKQGSFKKAALELGLSSSVVSYHISELEKRIDCALMYRSTRKLSLTHEGQILFVHAQKMLQEVEAGLAKVSSQDQQLKGKLSITLPSALTRSPLIAKIAQFHQAHPLIDLNIVFSDLRQDLIADSIDLAIRIGDMADSTLMSKRLGSIQRTLVCTPEFIKDQCLRNNIVIQTVLDLQPADIGNWPWIKLSMLNTKRRLLPRNTPISSSDIRSTKSIIREGLELDFNSSITVDSVEAMTQFCLLGSGIATPPDFLVEQALADQTLVELLPDWHVEDLPLYAVWHNSNVTKGPGNKKVECLIDFLAGNQVPQS